MEILMIMLYSLAWLVGASATVWLFPSESGDGHDRAAYVGLCTVLWPLMLAVNVVGAVMSRHGHEVPWHRVVQSTGGPNPASPVEALRRLRRDRTPMRGDKVDMRLARWDGRSNG